MGWSGNATIGFKGAGDFYADNDFSGSNSQLIACAKLVSNSSWTNVIYRLSKSMLLAKYYHLVVIKALTEL